MKQRCRYICTYRRGQFTQCGPLAFLYIYNVYIYMCTGRIHVYIYKCSVLWLCQGKRRQKGKKQDIVLWVYTYIYRECSIYVEEHASGTIKWKTCRRVLFIFRWGSRAKWIFYNSKHMRHMRIYVYTYIEYDCCVR